MQEFLKEFIHFLDGNRKEEIKDSLYRCESQSYAEELNEKLKFIKMLSWELHEFRHYLEHRK